MKSLFVSLFRRVATYLVAVFSLVFACISFAYLPSFSLHIEAYGSYCGIEEPYMLLSYRDDAVGEGYHYLGRDNAAYASYDGVTFKNSVSTNNLFMIDEADVPSFTIPLEGNFPLSESGAAISESVASRDGLSIGDVLYLPIDRDPFEFRIEAICSDYYGFFHYEADRKPGFVILGKGNGIDVSSYPRLLFTDTLYEDGFSTDEVYRVASFKDEAKQEAIKFSLIPSSIILLIYVASFVFDWRLFRRIVPGYRQYGFGLLSQFGFAAAENTLIALPFLIACLIAWAVGAFGLDALILSILVLVLAYALRLLLSLAAISLWRRKR